MYERISPCIHCIEAAYVPLNFNATYVYVYFPLPLALIPPYSCVT